MAISIETSRLRTSFTKEDITDKYDVETGITTTPTTNTTEKDTQLNHDELLSFIDAMGIKNQDEKDALAKWIFDNDPTTRDTALETTDDMKTNYISIDNLMTLLGGDDDKIDEDEVALTNVFAQSLASNDIASTTSTDALDYAFNLFDEKGVLETDKVNDLLDQIYDTQSPDDIATLRTILLALDVEPTTVDNIISGMSGDENMRRGTLQTLRPALNGVDADITTLNDKLAKLDLNTVSETGEAMNDELAPLSADKIVSDAAGNDTVTQADFAEAITERDETKDTSEAKENGEVDPARLAQVLVQMGVAKDKASADTIAANIITNNPDMTPADLAKNIGGDAGADITLTELRLNSYITYDNKSVDTTAFQALLEGSNDRATVIEEMYNFANIIFIPDTITALAGLEPAEIVTAIFGKKQDGTTENDLTKPVLLTDISENPDYGNASTDTASTPDRNGFAGAVAVSPNDTTPGTVDDKVDANKLATYLKKTGVIDSNTPEEEALQIAQNIIDLNGGSDVTAGELFDNIINPIDGSAVITAAQLITNAMVDDLGNVDIDAVRALLDANSNKATVINNLYTAVGITVPATGKDSATLGGESTDKIITAIFGETNGADVVTADSVKEFVTGFQADGTTPTTLEGATATDKASTADGKFTVSNNQVKMSDLETYITGDDGKINSDNLELALKEFEFSDTTKPSVKDMVAAWKDQSPAALATFLGYDDDIVTKNDIIFASAFIDYDKTSGTNKTVTPEGALDFSGELSEWAVWSALENYTSINDKTNFLTALLGKLGVTGDTTAFIASLSALNNADIVRKLAGFNPDGSPMTGSTGTYTAQDQSTATSQATVITLESVNNVITPTAVVPEIPADKTLTAEQFKTQVTNNNDNIVDPAKLATLLTTLGVILPAGKDATIVANELVAKYGTDATVMFNDIELLTNNVADNKLTKEDWAAAIVAAGTTTTTSNTLDGSSTPVETPVVTYEQMFIDIKGGGTPKETIANYFQSFGFQDTGDNADSDNYGDFDKKRGVIDNFLRQAGLITDDNVDDKFSVAENSGHEDKSWFEVVNRLASMTTTDIIDVLSRDFGDEVEHDGTVTKDDIMRGIYDAVTHNTFYQDDDMENYHTPD